MKISAVSLWIAVAAVLLPAAALGVMRAEDFARERLNAKHHAQIRVVKFAIPVVTPGDCRIWGQVVQIFKGETRTFRDGTSLEFDISCKRRNDLVPTGDTQWLEVRDLKQARFIETYLNSRRVDAATVYRVPAWQYRLIEAPSAQPMCPDTIKGPSCAEFEVPSIDVTDIARRLGSSDTTIRVTISEAMMRRLRVIAAQRSRERDFEHTTVSDVVGELIEERIEFLEQSVR
jgi:hypothetical protein